VQRIAGLTSAYLFSQKDDVTLFEANDFLGGHTCTKDVLVGNQTYTIDNGFYCF
jgi:predicted NAD/FAD-binding protein